MTSAWNPDQLFSQAKVGSEQERWGTPPSFFNRLHDEFAFELDAAAEAWSAKVTTYFGLDNPIPECRDALAVSWADYLGCRVKNASRFGFPTHVRARPPAVWLNPPYNRRVGDWLEKAHTEALEGCTVVVLIFARTSTAWWHDYAMKADEIRLVRGRLLFHDPVTRAPKLDKHGRKQSAPAPSAVLVFRPPWLASNGVVKGPAVSSMPARLAA